MEVNGFKRTMAIISDERVVVEEVVTDAHPQIAKIMSKLKY